MRSTNPWIWWTVAVAVAATPALGVVTVSDSFDAGWFSGPNTWTQGGYQATNPNVGNLIADFPQGDPRLADSSRPHAGGIFISSNAGPHWGGDNEQYWIDMVIQAAPNTTYTSFSVSADTQIYWTNVQQLHGKALLFYIGNSAEMDYGAQFNPDNAPTGPWKGLSWVGVNEHTAIQGALWNGDPYDRNGIWESWNWTSRPLAGDPSSITTGPDGLVIFRATIQNKNKFDGEVAFALDNLSVTLVPEPAALALLGLGALPLLRRRRPA